MSAELLALGFVNYALEQRAEDGRLDVRPVERVKPLEHGYLVCDQGRDVVVVEQAAIETWHVAHQEVATIFHRAEEL